MKTKKYALMVALGLIALLAPRTVRADDFTFSFTSGPGTSITGTVTGLVLGLTNNSTSAATGVILTSYPAALGLPVPNLDVLTGFTIFFNSFTETNGQITSANFDSRSASVTFSLGGNGVDDLANRSNGNLFLLNNAGFSAITFTPITATPVPEPSSILLLGTGVLGLMGMGLYKKRLA